MQIPEVSREQINAMNKKAQAMMEADGFDPNQVEQIPVQAEQMHPENEYPADYEPEEQLYEQQMQEQVEPEQEYVEHVEPEVVPDKYAYNKTENNLRTMRERAERAERERQEALDYIASLKKQHAPQEVDSLDRFQIDDDALIEGKHLKDIVQEVRQLKATLKNYENQSKTIKQQTVQMRLESQYPDINKVLTDDNLMLLQDSDPDLFDAIRNTKDEFKQGKLAYTMVKQMGIYKEKPTFDREKMLVQKNILKPRAMASLKPTQSDSPLTKLNAFASDPTSKESKEATWLEMQKIMKSR